jgi:hypothetical protein
MKSDQQQSPENWDAVLQRALKNLPERPAPVTLMPRVMAQVQVRAAEKLHQRLWRRRMFWVRATASAMLLATAASLSWLGGKLYETNISPVLDCCVAICRTVFGALAGSLIGNSFSFSTEAYHFTLIAAGLLLLAMYVTCVGVGSFVYRVVRR